MGKAVLGLSLWCAIVAVAACGREPAHVGLLLRAPQGLLDQAASVELRVSLDGNCNPASGRVIGETDPQVFQLDRCGAKWCKTIELDKDGLDRVFHVLAKTSGQTIARGCTLKAIDQKQLQVDITVKRTASPACCNDVELQSTEQCEGVPAMTNCAGMAPPSGDTKCIGIIADEVCECDCLAKEIELSLANTAAPAAHNDPGSKTDLALAFSGPMGASDDIGGSLRAVFTDAGGNGGDVNLRLLQKKLYPPMTAQLKGQLRLPLLCSAVTANGPNRMQRTPSIAAVSADLAAVVYVENVPQPTLFNVVLSAQGPNGCADKPPVVVNFDTSSNCDSPDVAGGPDGQALIVYNQGGSLRGRIYKTNGDLLPATAHIEIATIPAAAKPHVAGGYAGWMVVYSGAGGGIFFKTVTTAGAPGAETKVNAVADGTADQPDVAMLPDGRAVVVWQSGGKIFFQRYDAAAMPRPGDQGAPLSVQSPAPTSMAAVAAGASKWFAATWIAGDGTVWARFLGADSGFGLNHVNGQNSDFNATHPYFKSKRTGPAVAVSDAYVAIGWQDTSAGDDHHGMIVRRFPPPE